VSTAAERRPEEVDARDRGEPAPQLCGERRVVRGDPLRADARQLGDRRREGDGADHVRRASLLAVGESLRPDDLVEVHEVDRAATGEERVAVGEGGARADERPGAVRRVHLVAAERDEVGAGGKRPVRRELGRVDEDGHAALVGGSDDVVERGQPAGHVGGAGHREQARPRIGVERGDDRRGLERPVAVALDEAPRRRAGPRQQVGVVLDDGRRDVGGRQA
jgi:hypothetical protein